MSEKIKINAESPQNVEDANKVADVEHGVEGELSPEIIEKVMEKVGDINREGVAYYVIGATRQLEN